MEMLKIFPWDFGEKPFWVNEETNIHWFVEKELTKLCKDERVINLKKIDAVCFILASHDPAKNGQLLPVTRILLDTNTNEILADETSLEAMAVKIDILRLIATNDDQV